jgi:hypothetical protein
VLAGWAAHHDPAHRADAVILSLQGKEVARTVPERLRPDVVTLTGDQRFARSGWLVRLDPSPTVSIGTDVLTVKAVSDTGAETLFYAGTLADALWRSSSEECEALRIRQEEAQSAAGATLERLCRLAGELPAEDRLHELVSALERRSNLLAETLDACLIACRPAPWGVRLRRWLSNLRR